MNTTKDSADSRQAFENVLDRSDQQVAVFQASQRSLLSKVQHFLHGYPTMVPVIVLVLSLVVFGILAGERFFTAFNLSFVR